MRGTILHLNELLDNRIPTSELAAFHQAYSEQLDEKDMEIARLARALGIARTSLEQVSNTLRTPVRTQPEHTFERYGSDVAIVAGI